MINAEQQAFHFSRLDNQLGVESIFEVTKQYVGKTTEVNFSIDENQFK